MKRTSLNLDEEIYKKFIVYAKSRRRSASQELNLLMEEAVKRYEKLHPEPKDRQVDK